MTLLHERWGCLIGTLRAADHPHLPFRRHPLTSDENNGPSDLLETPLSVLGIYVHARMERSAYGVTCLLQIETLAHQLG